MSVHKVWVGTHEFIQVYEWRKCSLTLFCNLFIWFEIKFIVIDLKKKIVEIGILTLQWGVTEWEEHQQELAVKSVNEWFCFYSRFYCQNCSLLISLFIDEVIVIHSVKCDWFEVCLFLSTSWILQTIFHSIQTSVSFSQVKSKLKYLNKMITQWSYFLFYFVNHLHFPIYVLPVFFTLLIYFTCLWLSLIHVHPLWFVCSS